MTDIRVVLGQACCGLIGRFLFLRIFSVAISMSLHGCFIVDLALIIIFLKMHCTYELGIVDAN